MISTAFLLLLLIRAAVISACIFSASVDKVLPNHWDYLTIPRRTNRSCECGRFDPDHWDSSWNLYIHVKRGPLEKTCTGTIIASNLIVTSHKCLRLKGTRMRFFDVLQLKMQDSIAGVEEVTVTNTKTPTDHSVNFKAVRIFHNPQYAKSSELHKFPENDLLLIKVKENLLTRQEFTPICVPFHDVGRVGNVSGFYYGHSTDNQDATDDQKVKHNLKYDDVKVDPDVPLRHFGVILEKRVCFEHLRIQDTEETKEASFKKTLCFKFSTSGRRTNVAGGPLIYAFNSSRPSRSSLSSTAFLMGVASVITTVPGATGYEASTGQENAYFSSIKPLVKFIEYFAAHGEEEEKSVWCRTPTLKFRKMTRNALSRLQAGSDYWPWEDLAGPIKRDESLNCECGVPTSALQGRIVGGSETPAHEYGWMAVLIITKPDGITSICGGSLINDRVILTAAHCVFGGNSRAVVEPAKVEATFNAHLRHGDAQAIKAEVSAVLFHPDFLDYPYFDYDVALLILKEPLTFPTSGPGIRPVCLPEPGVYTPVVGVMATVAGWGLTTPSNGHLAHTLQHIQVPIQELSLCRSLLPGTKDDKNKFTDNFLCAGTLNRFKDAAGGDSGGPLMVQDDETHRWFEVGIVSYGYDEGKHPTKTAALYSDVQKLLPFVDYHARRVGAKWCRSKRLVTSPRRR